MPLNTQNPIILAVEEKLVEAIGIGVSQSPSRLIARILKSGVFCITSQAIDESESVKKLLDFLNSSNVILSSANKIICSDEFDEISIDEWADNVEFIVTSDILESRRSVEVDAQHINCDYGVAQKIVQRLARLGVKVKTNSQDQDFNALVHIFPNLCKKHNVELLPGKSEFAKRTLIGDPPEIIYEFNVLPEDMHKILMAESLYYAGYHHHGSILRLNEPNRLILKEGVMCIFPALELEDNTVLLRNAGCNITDVLATQLSFYIRQYLDDSLPISQCYGHRGTPISDKIADANQLSKAAKVCLNVDFAYEDVQEGISEVTVPANMLVNMDNSAYVIYSTLSAVPSDELKNLKSVEVPISAYLRAIIDIKAQALTKAQEELQKLKQRSTEIFSNPSQRECYQQSINDLEEVIQNLSGVVIPSLEHLLLKTNVQPDAMQNDQANSTTNQFKKF